MHLWAETYDRSLGETLNLQTDVAAHIARSLAMELVPDQVDVLGRSTPRRTEAYQAYLEGALPLESRQPRWRAIGDFLLRARARSRSRFCGRAFGDGACADFARESCARAGSRVPRAGKSVGAPGDRDRSGNLRCAPGARRDSAHARMELADGRRRISDRNRAVAELRDRRTASTAQFLAAMSRFGEAKAEADRACDVDPFCLVVTTSAAWVRYAAAEFDAAIDRSRHVLDMDAGYMPARRMLGAALLGAGRPEEAVEELTAAAGSGGDDPISLAWLAHAKALAGTRDEAQAIVARLESEAGRLCAGLSPRAGAHRAWKPRRGVRPAREGVRRARASGHQSQGRAAVRAAPARSSLWCPAAAASLCRSSRRVAFVQYFRPQNSQLIALISTGIRGGVMTAAELSSLSLLSQL